jgi:hypothetical protein
MSALTTINLEAISEQAERVNFSRSLLTVIAAILFAVGYSFGVMTRAFAWTAVALREGYRAGRRAGVSNAQLARTG